MRKETSDLSTRVLKTLKIFETFSTKYCFSRISVKKTLFLDLSVISSIIFGTVKLISFITNCGKAIRFLVQCDFSKKIHLIQGYPFTFMNDFPLKKRCSSLNFPLGIFRHCAFDKIFIIVDLCICKKN